MTITLSKEIEKQLADVLPADREAFVNLTLREALDALRYSNSKVHSIKELLTKRVKNLNQAVRIADLDQWESDTFGEWENRHKTAMA